MQQFSFSLFKKNPISNFISLIFLCSGILSLLILLYIEYLILLNSVDVFASNLASSNIVLASILYLLVIFSILL